MYMKFGTDFMDTELTFLQELCELLDGKLSILERQIKSVSDPESHGYFDQTEYFIGVGFCAMQRYTLDVLEGRDINRGLAYTLGPKHNSGKSIVSLISCLANWWKHTSEWQHYVFDGEQPKIGHKARQTIDSVLSIAKYPYVFSTGLVSLKVDGKIEVSSLIPSLIQWRKEVQEQASFNR